MPKKKQDIPKAYHNGNHRNLLIDIFLLLLGHILVIPLFGFEKYLGLGDPALEPK